MTIAEQIKTQLQNGIAAGKRAVTFTSSSNRTDVEAELQRCKPLLEKEFKIKISQWVSEIPFLVSTGDLKKDLFPQPGAAHNGSSVNLTW